MNIKQILFLVLAFLVLIFPINVFSTAQPIGPYYNDLILTYGASGLEVKAPLDPAYGGTGVANNAANTLTFTGNYSLGLTLTANTALTLPTSGTLYGTKADSITSAELLSSMTNETGTGVAVFGTAPTISDTLTLICTANNIIEVFHADDLVTPMFQMDAEGKISNPNVTYPIAQAGRVYFNDSTWFQYTAQFNAGVYTDTLVGTTGGSLDYISATQVAKSRYCFGAAAQYDLVMPRVADPNHIVQWDGSSEKKLVVGVIAEAENNSSGQYAREGYTTVNCDAVAVAKGDILIPSSTAGKATVDNSPEPYTALGIALTSKGAGVGTVTMLLNKGGGISSDETIRLLSTTTVSFAANADTTLYTVPTGKRCVLDHAIIVAAADAGATTTISIGANGAETDFVPANTLSNLDAQYDSVIVQPIPNTTPLKIKSYAAATVIEAQVANQSGVAGNTVYLFGIIY